MSLACYVLYLEHDNRPHEIWAFATRAEAELFAVSVAHDIWIDCEGGDPETDEFPFGEQLHEILQQNNEYFRLYRCEDEESQQLTLLRNPARRSRITQQRHSLLRVTPSFMQENVMSQFTPFRVEVLFRHYRNDLPPGLLRALEPLKLRYEVIPTQDPYEDTAFGMISGHTELAEDDIGDWVQKIIAPFNGDVLSWGFAWRWTP